ncbi:MAG: Hpt domain-containing protein [Deltaproteobacteria bacterium]|nr:Hpt domain-containing protein [Deltaproteobacteria bacterium]
MADRFSIDNIRELFRDDVRRFLHGMEARLEQLISNPRDTAALDEMRALGHSLKGTASLVGLTYLSRAGSVIDRVAEVAETHGQSDAGEALAIFRQMQAALPVIDRLLEDCLAGTNPETQENLYTELLLTFSARTRTYLHEVDASIDLGAAADSAPPADEPADAESEDAESDDAEGDEADESETAAHAESAPTADDEWAKELAEIFAAELESHLERVPNLIALLAEPTQQADVCKQLSRIFHTIKGSAAMVGLNDLSTIGKQLQDAFGAPAEQPDRLPLAPDFLATTYEAMAKVFAAAGKPPPALPRLAPPLLVDANVADLDRELLDAFTIDATEAIEASEHLLLQLERQPDDRELLQALFRHFHTLKGAAAAVGLERVAEQLHHGESLLEAVLDSEVSVDAVKLVDFLFRLTDSVTGLINTARGVRDEQRTILGDVGAEVTTLMMAAPTPVEAEVSGRRVTGVPEAEGDMAPESLAARGADSETSIVRVQASRLDALMNQVGQLVVSRTRMDRKIQAFAELRDKLYFCRTRLAEIIEGFQGRYEFNTGDRQMTMAPGRAASAPRPTNGGETHGATERGGSADDFFTDLEFDKYDDINILSRSVIELATDTGEIADQLGGFIDAFGEEARQFSKITTGLQRQITRLRLVPLDTLFRRLLRPVRDAARQEGKLVDLHFEGTDVQLDKSIVEALYAPLLHMVRNAVSHGIESPAVRQAGGKATVGTIRISATQRHNSVLLFVQDDGAGLDFDAIAARGRTLGLIAPSVAPSREQLLPLIFRPGFSTGETVTDLSGRGVGMDVVARDITKLNGSLLVDSKDGLGTTIRIALPTTTSIDEVLLLEAGPQVYGLPVDFVEQVIAVEMSELVDVDGQRMLRVRNELLPVLLLAPLVGETVPSEHGVAVLLRAGERALALIVDRVQAQQEVVIRPLGRVLDAHPFLSGATISGAGAVIFVLHVGRLFDVLAAVADRQPTFIMNESSDAPVVEARAVLVVDDSISVRKLAQRFVESGGLEVETAVDGIDAMEKLASGRFRIVVTDLEMPRMHGYELIAEIRRHPQYRHLPVIVCSSRSSEKHRRRAQEAGAQGYITKPFTKEQLLAELERLMEGRAEPMRGNGSASLSG